MAKILVVGGAGYVGSAACAWLQERGHAVWILDDLSTGHEPFVSALGVRGFVRAKAGDRAQVLPLLQRERFDAVMHFAARASVAESVEYPEIYRENNVEQTEALLHMMLETGLRRFIFSSTCAIFGDPGTDRISEETAKNPINPYGQTKLETEHLLEKLAREKGLISVALRYFNAAGAEPELRVGEWHENEFHLIPRVFRAIRTGKPVSVFGTDYPTPDGSCIRDYIHVTDLAQAHEAAMLKILGSTEGSFEAYNLGSGKGYSVREIIETCSRVIGSKLEVVEKPRRAGDPPRLVADSSKAQRELGFKPGERSLDEIIRSAWDWEQRLTRRLRKAVFLDRDGTINEDPGYLSDPGQLKLLPNVGPALARLKKAGYLLVVVSNQSGVGRGLIEVEALEEIHARLDHFISESGASIDRYELCYHHPDDSCECRKPKPNLIYNAARKLEIDLTRSFMVGDKIADLGAGTSAGCRNAILVRTGDGAKTEEEIRSGKYPEFKDALVVDSLAHAADWILAQDAMT